MITTELIAYIQQELALGMSLDELKEKLAQSGWTSENIEEGIASATHPATKQYAASHITFSQRISNEFNTLLSDTFRLYKGNLKTILIIQSVQAAVYITSFITSLLVSLLFSPASPLLVAIITVSLDIILGIVSIIPHLSLIYAIKDTVKHQSKIKDYFCRGLSNVLRYLLMMSIPGLIIAGVIILIFILNGVTALIFNAFFSDFAFLKELMFLLSYLLGIIMVCLVSGWYFLSIYVFVAEDTGVWETLKRSKFYAQDNLLRIFLHGIIIGITFLVLIIIPFVGIFISLFFTIPLANIYFYKLYEKIKSVKKPVNALN